MAELRYRRAADVAVIDEPGDDSVYVAKLPSGPLLILRDSAADIWRLVTSRSLDRATLLLELGIDDGDMEAAADEFVEDLVRRGLILAT